MKKILSLVLCGVMCCTLLTGCGNDHLSKDNSSNFSKTESTSESTGKIENWDKNRIGDTLSNNDEIQENIIYRVEKMEDGNYILFFKNNNDYGVNIFFYLDYYDSSKSMENMIGTMQATASCVKAGGIGAVKINNITANYDTYKVRLVVQKKDFEDGSQYIDFEESEKDGKLNISAINNYEDDLKGVNVMVVYYKDNKIITCDEANVGYGRYVIVSDYPKNENNEKLDYDKYEIYLNTAYISQ